MRFLESSRITVPGEDPPAVDPHQMKRRTRLPEATGLYLPQLLRLGGAGPLGSLPSGREKMRTHILPMYVYAITASSSSCDVVITGWLSCLIDSALK